MTVRRAGRAFSSLAVITVCALGPAACRAPDRSGGSAGAGGASELPSGAVPVTLPLPPAPPPTTATPALSGAPLVSSAPLTFAPLVHAADASVVIISTVTTEAEVSPFTHRRRQALARGLGTGFVFDKSGVILTNDHVIEGAQEIEVKLSDLRSFPARVVGFDKVTDLGVLHIDAKDLKPLPLGDSDALEVGDWAVAIGNPFGLSHTVSAGIISAKGRTQRGRPARPCRLLRLLADRRLDQPRQLRRAAAQPQGRSRGHQLGHPRGRRAGDWLCHPREHGQAAAPDAAARRQGHAQRPGGAYPGRPRAGRRRSAGPQDPRRHQRCGHRVRRERRPCGQGGRCSRATSSSPSMAPPSSAERSFSGWRARRASAGVVTVRGAARRQAVRPEGHPRPAPRPACAPALARGGKTVLP